MLLEGLVTFLVTPDLAGLAFADLEREFASFDAVPLVRSELVLALVALLDNPTFVSELVRARVFELFERRSAVPVPAGLGLCWALEAARSLVVRVIGTRRCNEVEDRGLSTAVKERFRRVFFLVVSVLPCGGGGG